MDRRRRSNTNCIHLSEKRLVILKVGCAVLIGDFFCLNRIGVDNTDKIHIRHMVVFLGVEFTQIADTYNTDAQLFH